MALTISHKSFGVWIGISLLVHILFFLRPLDLETQPLSVGQRSRVYLHDLNYQEVEQAPKASVAKPQVKPQTKPQVNPKAAKPIASKPQTTTPATTVKPIPVQPTQPPKTPSDDWASEVNVSNIAKMKSSALKGGVENPDPIMAQYARQVEAIVSQRWKRKLNLISANRFTSEKIKIVFTVNRSGKVVQASLKGQSRQGQLKSTALNSLRTASLPPLPQKWKSSQWKAVYVFEYSP